MTDGEDTEEEEDPEICPVCNDKNDPTQVQWILYVVYRMKFLKIDPTKTKSINDHSLFPIFEITFTN